MPILRLHSALPVATGRLRVPKGIAGWWGGVPSWSQLMGQTRPGGCSSLRAAPAPATGQSGTRALRPSLCREGRVISSLGRAGAMGWIVQYKQTPWRGCREKTPRSIYILQQMPFKSHFKTEHDSHHLPLSPPPPRPHRDSAGAVAGITTFHWGKSTAFHLESETLLGKGKRTDDDKICEIMVKQAEVNLKAKSSMWAIFNIFFQNSVHVGFREG